ncbi:hypothetical protein L7F22_041350 [Adiantum nelumboides]|nr:hypothetical protein [Adiantum nelumboides]
MQSQASIQALKTLCEQGQIHQALEYVGSICATARCKASSLYARLLQCCLDEYDLAGGIAIQSLISRNGLDSDAVLGSYLIRLHTASGRLAEASQVFHKIHEPNVFTWSAIIAANSKLGHDETALQLYVIMQQSGLDADAHVYLAVLKASATSGKLLYGLVQHGYENKALSYFQQMHASGRLATKVTFTCILKACSNLANLNQGMLIHSFVIKTGNDSDCGVSNTLIDLYLRCRSSLDGLALYRQCAKRNLVTWNIIISGLVQQGHGDRALGCWVDLLREGANPDRISFVSSLQACVSVGALHEGKLIHMHMLELDVGLDTSVGNTLLDMYCECGGLDDACKLFTDLPKQDAVAWNVMMKGMIQQNHEWEALQIFQRMQLEGILATGFTYVCVLNASASVSASVHGKVLHACVLANGFHVDVQTSNALMNMYIKCKSLNDAHKVFDRHVQHDMGAWNTMLAGYIECGKGQQALEMFADLHQIGLEPDRITFICILKACPVVAALVEGRRVHSYIVDKGLESKVSVLNAVIDMYGKWGSMADSQKVFDMSLTQNVVTWSALMSGYIRQGEDKLVLKIFKNMQHEGIKPDGISLACVLSACGHLGKVEEGNDYVHTLIADYGNLLGIQHCNHSIDLLGRAGLLSETLHFLENMPFQSNSIGWSSLLGHCNTHGNVGLGRLCLTNIVETDEEFPTGVALMSNLYAQSYE